MMTKTSQKSTTKPSKKPLITHGDEAYAALLQAHEGLSDDESAAFNARLILLMLNELDDAARFQELLKAAR